MNLHLIGTTHLWFFTYQAQMTRRVKQYLGNLVVEDDEEELRDLSLKCEPIANTGMMLVIFWKNKVVHIGYFLKNRLSILVIFLKKQGVHIGYFFEKQGVHIGYFWKNRVSKLVIFLKNRVSKLVIFWKTGCPNWLFF